MNSTMALRIPLRPTSRQIVEGGLLRASSTGRTKAFQYASRRFKSSQASQNSSASFSTVATGAGAAAGSKSFGTRLWTSYTAALETNPLRTKMTAAALIFFSSDSVTQHIMDPDQPWDASRASSGAIFGIVATGYLHFWWGFLESTIGSLVPAARSRIANTAAKVFIDQGVGAPLYIFSYYIMTNTIQRFAAENNEPMSLQKAKTILVETEERARHMLWPTMMQHWKVWPLVHSFNFYFVPLQHRVLIQNTVLVGWSGYLSHLNKTGLGTGEDDDGKLLTPEKEIETAIKRRYTVKSLA